MRSAVIRFLLVLGLATSGALLGCGHGGGSSSTVAKIVLSPSSLSLNPGDVIQVTASAQNASGGTVLSGTITYSVTNGSVITVSTSGLVCAGTWDSLTTPINCKPGGLGTATLTASSTSGGSTIASNSVPVTVHAKIDRITVAALVPAGANSVPDCISQGATAPANTLQYQATAFSNGTPVCGAPPNPSCGTFTWNTNNTSVAVISSTQPANQDPSQITVTAGKPGTANVFASISGVTSVPAPFTSCPITSIAAHASGGQATTFTLNTGATQQLAADVLDSHGVAVPTPPITWNSSQPHVASVGSSTGLITASNPGTASISVSCTPPICNTGLNAVYGNLDIVTVSGTSAQTVYATTTAAPASGSNSIIPIDNNSVGTAIALPAGDSVNSLVFARDGSAGYVGSESGLFALNPSTNALASPVTAVTGQVLTISPDAQHVVVSDFANPDPTKRVVYIYNPASGTVEATLNDITNATAAAYSPDVFKLFIVGGGTLYVYTGVVHPIGNGNDVDVLASGHVALAAVQQVGDAVFAVCNNSLLTSVGTGSPLFVRGMPNGTGVVDLAPPEVHQFDVSVGGACPPTFAVTSAPSTHTFGNPPLAGFTASQLLITPDSSRAIVLSDQGVLVYNIGTGSTSIVTLSNGAQPTTGAVTLDSTTLYVGGSDNAVHRIDLTANNGAGADVETIPPPPATLQFKPDLVAIRPK